MSKKQHIRYALRRFSDIWIDGADGGSGVASGNIDQCGRKF